MAAAAAVLAEGTSELTAIDPTCVITPANPSYNGCTHYKRRAQLVAPCCRRVYACRFCHDEREDEAQPDVKRKHTLNRHAVTTVRCGACGRVQASAKTCTGCGVELGRYFCRICNLFDNEDKGQWHCEGCGICRVGGQDNFWHCDTCGSCLPLRDRSTHKCLRDRLRANCSVCLEDLHTSRRASVFMRCGHAIHNDCYTSLLSAAAPKCPLCQASVVDMSRHWRRMDMLALETPMPSDYRSWVRVLCNDCHEENDARFHIVGLKCGAPSCGSYNTRRVGPAKAVHDESEAAERARLSQVASDALSSLRSIAAAAARAASGQAPPDASAPVYATRLEAWNALGRDAAGFPMDLRLSLLGALSVGHAGEEELGQAEDGDGEGDEILMAMQEDGDDEEADEEDDEDEEEGVDEDEDEEDDEEGPPVADEAEPADVSAPHLALVSEPSSSSSAPSVPAPIPQSSPAASDARSPPHRDGDDPSSSHQE